jgi:hypothetical protein
MPPLTNRLRAYPVRQVVQPFGSIALQLTGHSRYLTHHLYLGIDICKLDFHFLIVIVLPNIISSIF